MTPKKQTGKTFEYFFNIKEKKISLPEYVILKKAFLEGLLITKEWLENFEKHDQTYNETIDKILGHINFESIDYELRILETLRTEEVANVFDFIDSQVVLRPSVVTKTTSITPKIARPVSAPISYHGKSKEKLKEEINELYKQEENYDLCLTKTTELLQHPELTDEERQRYNTFYHELHEWVNLKNKKQEQERKKVEPPTQDQPKPQVVESRGTSISQLRSDMLKELGKLRQLYIDKEDE